jgi:hypothetical protein
LDRLCGGDLPAQPGSFFHRPLVTPDDRTANRFLIGAYQDVTGTLTRESKGGHPFWEDLFQDFLENRANSIPPVTGFLFSPAWCRGMEDNGGIGLAQQATFLIKSGCLDARSTNV